VASPQLEDGYTRIANELLEAIIIFPFSKREYKVVLSITRLTYGFNKKSAVISNWHLAKMAGIRRDHISGVIKSLAEAGVITVPKTGTVKHGQVVFNIAINKDL
jgi:phage replication O-like protein O